MLVRTFRPFESSELLPWDHSMQCGPEIIAVLPYVSHLPKMYPFHCQRCARAAKVDLCFENLQSYCTCTVCMLTPLSTDKIT